MRDLLTRQIPVSTLLIAMTAFILGQVAICAEMKVFDELTVLGNTFLAAEEGNVGIGTSNPSSKLEVNGDIHITSGGLRFPDGTVQISAAILCAPPFTQSRFTRPWATKKQRG